MKTLSISKIFLKLKAKEIWYILKDIIGFFDIKKIGIIIICYCIGVWVFGGCILEPYHTSIREYTTTMKYIIAPVLFVILSIYFLAIIFVLYSILKWFCKCMKENWNKASIIYTVREIKKLEECHKDVERR